METAYDNESGFSDNEVHGARIAFFRDCPNGSCSKRKFLTFIRKSCVQKCSPLNIRIIIFLKDYRHCKKFFSMMFDIYDRNHDGHLDFDEYIYALSAITGANRLRTIETLFKFFDIENQGFITRKEFDSRKKLAAQFLGQYKPGITDNLYEKAFSTLDTNKDGFISKEEFFQWHLKDHSMSQDDKSIKKRPRLLRSSMTPLNINGQIKTSSLQGKDKHSIDLWLEATTDTNHAQELSSINNIDRHLLKIFYRARRHFHQARTRMNDNQSDSGVFTLSSSATTLTDSEFDANSFFDINNQDNCQSNLNDDTDEEFLCQSLENALMETLLELKQKRLNNNTSIEDNGKVELTRF
ncbi:unnamed protein product [Rotaria magnacalcarata]|uniref:EF-hand domain-containing protein n=5 Tax=Rotaria magnacalcarata TaxID=392030 RepID=A0A819SV17_9BILA|nr:unnamed protein product [Rotaria magnacalcarata]CAF2102344.1 unnamed protein product [Rotaria magnacalcarata]CAF2159982.1 unnamed protein product [Rotaria magnacalcarata]CAF2201076.1 unnamed protein product [Rotaria magnacalcarata]CAF4067099.1 unnamed protein product [Rotaria magnacalcarata]